MIKGIYWSVGLLALAAAAMAPAPTWARGVAGHMGMHHLGSALHTQHAASCTDMQAGSGSAGAANERPDAAQNAAAAGQPGCAR